MEGLGGGKVGWGSHTPLVLITSQRRTGASSRLGCVAHELPRFSQGAPCENLGEWCILTTRARTRAMDMNSSIRVDDGRQLTQAALTAVVDR